QIRGIVPALGEQQWWAGVFVVFGFGFDRALRKRATDPGFLSRISSQLPQVLTGALLDGNRLISPGRATAGIDAARVLQHVGLCPRTLHFHGLAVLEVRHMS